MLSCRLNPELERHLDFLSAKSGLSKNQIVTAAIEQYIKQQDLGTVPLTQQVQEAEYKTFQRRLDVAADEFKNAAAATKWAQESAIWTARPNPSGDVTGAIHGRNIVMGHSAAQDESTLVISKHLPAIPSVGVDSYFYYVTPFEIWKQHMYQCQPA